MHCTKRAQQPVTVTVSVWYSVSLYTAVTACQHDTVADCMVMWLYGVVTLTLTDCLCDECILLFLYDAMTDCVMR